jgi:hypothetical protein
VTWTMSSLADASSDESSAGGLGARFRLLMGRKA